MATDTLDTTTTLQEFFKQNYSNFLGDDIPTGDDFAMMIEKEGSTETCGGLGLDVKWAHKTGDGVGRGALTEGGTFPTPISSNAQQFTLALTHRAYSVMWTGHSEAMGESEKMGWIRGIAKEKGEEIAAAAKLEASRWALHTGSPILGQITAIESSGTNKYITVDGASIHFYQQNQQITTYDAASGGNLTQTARIVDVDYVQGRIVCSTTVSMSVGNYVTWLGYYDKTVPNGLQNLVAATGTIQGVTRTSVGFYFSQAVSYAYSASVTALTPDILRDLVKNQARTRGSYNHTYVLHPTVRQWFSTACVGMNRFANMEFNVGVSKMKVATERGDQTWVESPMLPTGKFWIVDASKFVKAYPEGMKGGYAKTVGGKTILPVYDGDGAMRDKSQMIWIVRDNRGCRDFRCQGVGTGLTSP